MDGWICLSVMPVSCDVQTKFSRHLFILHDIGQRSRSPVKMILKIFARVFVRGGGHYIENV